MTTNSLFILGKFVIGLKVLAAQLFLPIKFIMTLLKMHTEKYGRPCI